MTERKRLHISPFDAELLPTILPPPILKTATNISYHTLQAFPERNYGYVELPVMEAEKIKKKLNGSILKGSKMHIEAARPENASKMAREEEGANETDSKKKKAKKTKAKREEGVLPGYELPMNRKVKRGWTEPPSKDKISKTLKDRGDKKAKPKKSSFTDKSECLFKTAVPPNATRLGNSSVVDGSKRKKRKRGESDRAIVVHEFENTIKHASFLRNDQIRAGNKAGSKFVDDVGWVDEDGNVVEAVPQTRKANMNGGKKNSPSSEKMKPNKERERNSKVPAISRNQVIEDDETSSSGISSSERDSDSEARNKTNPSAASPVPKEGSKANSKANSEAGDNDTKTAPNLEGSPKQGTQTDQLNSLSITRSSATPPPSSPQSPSNQLLERQVHPLEALFKRPTNPPSQTPKKPALEVRTSFSSLEPGDPDAENGNTKLLVPHTPFTQQDIRQRRQRSAAPTPDTAAPGKTFNFGFGDAGDDEDERDDDVAEDAGEEASGAAPAGTQDTELPAAPGEKEESEFSKWFWEHRGETNRAWKKRRRDAAKEKRQKDNKERSRRSRQAVE